MDSPHQYILTHFMDESLGKVTFLVTPLVGVILDPASVTRLATPHHNKQATTVPWQISTPGKLDMSSHAQLGVTAFTKQA